MGQNIMLQRYISQREKVTLKVISQPAKRYIERGFGVFMCVCWGGGGGLQARSNDG